MIKIRERTTPFFNNLFSCILLLSIYTLCNNKFIPGVLSRLLRCFAPPRFLLLVTMLLFIISQQEQRVSLRIFSTPEIVFPIEPEKPFIKFLNPLAPQSFC
jgi:hypothetical protein